MPATPKKGRRFGGDAAHQKAMFGNLVASLIAAEAIVTTEAKAKHLRPIAEKMVTKAKKGGVHNHRQVVAYIRDKEMASKLFDEIGPRFTDRPGGYTRITKIGTRRGDAAPVSVVELTQRGDLVQSEADKKRERKRRAAQKKQDSARALPPGMGR